MENLKPQTENQKKLYNALNDERISIVGVFGPTGTGKSLFTIAYGLDSVIEGKYERFILIKPIVDVTRRKEISIIELKDLFFKLVLEYLKDIVSLLRVDWKEIEKLINEGKLIIADTSSLQGRTFDNSIIFVDDAHFLSPQSAYEILMRIGSNSKFVIAGDPVLQGDEKSGISILRDVLLGETRAVVVDLGIKDIIRPGAKIGIRLLIEAKMRSREMSEEEQRVKEAILEEIPNADIVTVMDLRSKKESWEIPLPQVPDFLIIVKEGTAGRIIGKRGETINMLEQKIGASIRVLESTLDFKNYVKAFHPVGWVANYIKDVDFSGPYLTFTLEKHARGPFIGSRGAHIRAKVRVSS